LHPAHGCASRAAGDCPVERSRRTRVPVRQPDLEAITDQEYPTKSRFAFALATAALALALPLAPEAVAQAPKGSPNIVVIMTDDLAPMDVSAIHRGLGAVNTPNIDRIAKEGLMVSDYYAQPSCTTGRSAFITGRYPIRTGLTTVGQPGAPLGLQFEDVTLAELLKARGYVTGQFGKSHVGDRNDHLPTVHGFDEFFGILYHLNVMEMYEQPDFPKNPNFPGRPRNVIYSWASATDDATVDPRFGKVGRQRIEDRGPLPGKRMETFDDEVTAATIDWLKRAQASGKPFFLWYKPTRMHQKNHVSPEWYGKSGHGVYADGLLHLDALVGRVVKQLDDMGLPATRSCSSRRTTASISRTGPIRAHRGSAARKGRPGTAGSACRCSSAGPGRSLRTRGPASS
jgi:arylsulfatase